MDNPSEQVRGPALWRSRDFVLFREADPDLGRVLRLETLQDHPEPVVLSRMHHALGLAPILDPAWATIPLAFREAGGRASLVLADPGGVLLGEILARHGEDRDGTDMAARLRLAIALAQALARLHATGLIHKNVNPGVFLVAPDDGRAWLTGFTLASMVSRERRAGARTATIGSLPHASPEQTGRMNRSVDSRSDLYALGVVLFELFTGRLPFSAEDSLEWVHCHVARQPLTPLDVAPDLPAIVSDIILKLLSKMAEDRYQSASGLAADLTACLESLTTCGFIPRFALGERDNPGRLMVPETLYGRERPLSVLTTTLDRVRESGTVALILVAGSSGVGKSALITRFQAMALDRGATFGGGKFDQHKRDIPYVTFAQAFDSLVRQVLSEDDARVAEARRAIQKAVGQNGRLLTDLIPVLESLIGPQPPVPDLPVSEARVRFQSVFGRFIQVFAIADHPLVLALDDLQWIDSASLRMLEYLCGRPDLGRLLIVGSYRSNETPPSHPMMLALETIRSTGTPVTTVALEPLAQMDLARMVADCLRAPPDQVAPLLALVREKTGGTPFFVIQFLEALVDDGLLSVDPRSCEWLWDTDKIRGKGFTDNLVDLMTARLNRLPDAVQDELRRIACLGNAVDLSTLALVQDRTEDAVLVGVSQALRAELLYHDAGRLVFLHDRVREAAYRSMPETERVAAHLRIGRILADTLSPEVLESEIFDVIHHWNQARDQITDPGERDRLCDLNMTAGRRARASTAHASALVYFRLARDLLPADSWSVAPARTFDLLLDLAESESLAGHHDEADALFTRLLERAPSSDQAVRVWRLRFRLFMVAGKVVEALTVAIDALAQFGLTCPETPEAMEAALARERADLRATVDRIGLEALRNQPDCDDPQTRNLLGLIADAIPVVFHVKPPLYPYLGLKGINLSLRHGATGESCAAFSGYGVWLMASFEDIPAAVAFSEAALRLAERSDAAPLLGATQFRHGYFVALWRRPLADCLRILDDSFRSCIETGDWIYAASAASTSGWYCVEQGLPLSVYAERLDRFASFVDSTRIPWATSLLRLQTLMLATLRGEDGDPGGEGGGDRVTTLEADTRATLEATGHTHALAVYHAMKQVQLFMLGHVDRSLDQADIAAGMSVKLVSSLALFTHVFYAAMAMACLRDEAPAERWATLAPRFDGHRRQLRRWAENCPESFRAHHLLVEAEAAHVEARDMDALSLYEQAIAAARETGRLPVEGIACERAGRLAREIGLGTAAGAYMRDARYAFERWGAVAKVRHLDRTHPGLADAAWDDGRASDQIGVGDLDLAAVIKAQQAVSGQIVLSKLVEALLRIVVEHAGADRGLLLMRQTDTFLVAAEATVGDGGITVASGSRPVDDDALAMTVFHYVARTRERVLVDNAAEPGIVGTEGYAARTGVRSIVCLPVMTRGEMTTILYLENRLAANAFTRNRVAVLDMLISQASISLENATLYADMEDRVRARTRDLVQSLDLVRTKGEQVGILLDNSDQGFLSCDRSLIVDVEYSRACETMLDTMPAGQRIDQLLWADTPASADLIRDVIPTVLDDIDPLRAEMMIGLLPSEIVRRDRILEAQYKVLENRHMMLVLTDVTAERRLRERVSEERRHLEMIVAAVTEGHEFFETVASVRAFAREGLEALLASGAAPETVVRDIYREVHTLKGMLNQFSFSATPRALHALEDTLTLLRDGETPPGLAAVAEAVRAVPCADLLDRDLDVIRQVLGEEFLAAGKRVMLTQDQVRRLKRLAADLLAGRVVNVAAGEIRTLLLEVGALGKVSVKQALAGFAPLVQRLAERDDKDVEPLEVLGADLLVEPDRFSPFLRSLGHVVRNAVTHGIEPPQERLRRAKAAAGRVTCVVLDQGETIRIEIADDGGGIDPEALRRRAAFLFGPRTVRDLSSQGVMDLLFLDGLSTREVANDVAGRGVGMAAVRHAVRGLGGDIQVDTEPGRGTRFIFTVRNAGGEGPE
ncbi:AAA family ATPase [Roseospira visakhapatnamensis]|uniref:Chemotaxis protein CheA n=1 Tax=Roseospira visakhapatnamensis TaxID=390880 RepID=A0A7W6RDX3_9PROT|nr:AAA family ATPase [Roseospira visakhapatnamensis]MBB4266769.1 putative ATPase/GAF domain-containing protein/two-component sensor histidine kinase [Roseospira visakhapatnamensis]